MKLEGRFEKVLEVEPAVDPFVDESAVIVRER